GNFLHRARNRWSGLFESRPLAACRSESMTTLLKLDDAHKAYGERNLLDGTSAEFQDDHKVGFIGRNGAGKSTLVRILLGEEELDKGELARHPKLRLGYLRQHDP